jgi:hypothetical protein
MSVAIICDTEKLQFETPNNFFLKLSFRQTETTKPLTLDESISSLLVLATTTTTKIEYDSYLKFKEFVYVTNLTHQSQLV